MDAAVVPLCALVSPSAHGVGQPNMKNHLSGVHNLIRVLTQNRRISRLKRNLARKLDNSRARAEVQLRAQRRLKWRPRRPQADGHGASTSCRGRELGGAHRSIVYAVEGVVGFKNELCLDALCERDALSDSRIERNEVGKIEGVPAESRRTVGAAVAVCICVRVHQTGVRLSGFGSQDTAELPSAGQITPRTVQRMCIAVEVP